MSDLATINKWGNSLGVRLPKSYCEQLRLVEGDEVSMLLEDDQITIAAPLAHYTLRGRMQNWDGARLKIEEIDWGKPAGREIW